MKCHICGAAQGALLFMSYLRWVCPPCYKKVHSLGSKAVASNNAAHYTMRATHLLGSNDKVVGSDTMRATALSPLGPPVQRAENGVNGLLSAPTRQGVPCS